MDRKHIDECHFWTLLAIADEQRNQSDIRNRLADLFRASGASRQMPGALRPTLNTLRARGFVEEFSRGLWRQIDYRLTEAGRQACRDEIELRRRELDVIDKDARCWLGGPARR